MRDVWRLTSKSEECGHPADLPVFWAGPAQWAFLTGPTYPNRRSVHVHRWPTHECSLVMTARQEAQPD